MERQEDTTPTKSDASSNDGDTGINPVIPIIGVAIVGGAVVATVYSSKHKKGNEEDAADAARKQ